MSGPRIASTEEAHAFEGSSDGPHCAVCSAPHFEHMEPGRWWRAIGPDGELWCETSDEEEVRQMARPGDRIERLYTMTVSEWREVTSP